jgi:TfoX/Sxy family transcriptional regulator of competence genes
MAFDEGLAVRIEEALVDVPHVEQKKMFGGLAFMVRQHMCVGVIDDMLMARVGPEQYADCLKEKFAKEMTFTGKPLKGMVYVEPEGVSEDEQLSEWIEKCLNYVASLPDKQTNVRKKKK